MSVSVIGYCLIKSFAHWLLVIALAGALIIGLSPITNHQSLITTVYAQTDNLGPDPANLSNLQQLIQRLINISVYLAGFVLTLALVWGGIKFLISGGDSKSVQSAYDILTWALLGLVFLALAWLILLLIQTFTGVSVTNFCLGFNCV